MISLPRHANEFTADWLNDALTERQLLGEHRIIDVDVLDSDIPGQTAEVARLIVTYSSDDCPLPRQLIAKYTSRNQSLIESVINQYQQYWRETSFYLEFPDAGIARPDCLFAQHNPETQEFVLLMKDLSPSASPSWASTPAQVAEAVSHLPAFHARWWNAPSLREKDWLVQYDNRDFFRAAAGAAAASVPAVRALFGSDADATIEMMEFYAANIEKVLDYYGERDFTLVHGDYHPKQLFFPTDAGGEFAVIDWQFSFVNTGALDLARIMIMGQSIEARRAAETTLLNGYLEGLLAEGVTDYTMAQLEDDYRVGIAANQMIMMIAVGDTDISLVEKECASLGLDFRDVCLLRGDAAVRDWDVLAFLREMVGGS